MEWKRLQQSSRSCELGLLHNGKHVFQTAKELFSDGFLLIYLSSQQIRTIAMHN